MSCRKHTLRRSLLCIEKGMKPNEGNRKLLTQALQLEPFLQQRQTFAGLCFFFWNFRLFLDEESIDYQIRLGLTGAVSAETAQYLFFSALSFVAVFSAEKGLSRPS